MMFRMKVVLLCKHSHLIALNTIPAYSMCIPYNLITNILKIVLIFC